jgi:small ligand-binding sensory domain FIST
VLSQTCDVVRTESPHVTLARIVRLDADAARDARAGKRPSERVFMGAHFKIAQSARVSPRVHYLDATATTGCIYVGYIGPHLPTATS